MDREITRFERQAQRPDGTIPPAPIPGQTCTVWVRHSYRDARCERPAKVWSKDGLPRCELHRKRD